MAGELVFITGSTGFVGFAVLVSLLKAGYHARISLRKESQVPHIKNQASVVPFQDKIEFVVVPDITVPGAFDAVLEGVKYVLHTASQLGFPTENPEQDIINPAIYGTTSILNSALKFPAIKRVVITSSVTAVVPPPALMIGDPTTVYTSSSRTRPLPTGPWSDPRIAYLNAKTLALDATDRFLVNQKPKFSIINIMPSFVIGRNELATDLKTLSTGSNGVVLGVLSGEKSDSPRPAAVVDVRDVARIHVEALDEEKVKGNKDFILNAGVESYDAANEIARRAYPDEAKSGVLPLGGSMPLTRSIVDVSETIKTFGALRPYEDMVKYLAGQYIELRKADGVV